MNALNNHWIFSAKDGLTRPRFRQRNPSDNQGDPIARPPRFTRNWRTILKHLHVFSLSVLLTLASGFATPTFAADIEIYSDTLDTSGVLKPNILFMLDNSGSMQYIPGADILPNDHEANPEGYKSRLEYLRDAMEATGEAVGGLANIALGRFTHSGTANNIASNAPIVFPAIPDPSAGILQRVSVPIRQSQDDAMENETTGDMNLTNKSLLVLSDTTVTVGSSTYEISLDSRSGQIWKYRVKRISGSDESFSWVLNTACDVNLGADINSSDEVFEFSLDKKYPGTLVDVQINGSVQGEIVGPNCGATSAATTEGSLFFSPSMTITEEGQYKVSVEAVEDGNGKIEWTYKAETANGSEVSQFALTGPEGTGKTWWDCQNHKPNGSTKITISSGDLDLKGISWSNVGEVSFKKTNSYPVGYVEAWFADSSGHWTKGVNPILGPLCVETTATKTVSLKCTGEGCVGAQSTYQLDLSVNENLWTYQLKLVSGNNILDKWAIRDIPASCFTKLAESSSYTLDESKRSVAWAIGDNFTAGDVQTFSFQLNSDPSIALNNNSVPVGRVNVRLPESSNTTASQVNFDFVGPGYCEEPPTCPKLSNSSQGNEMMTICHFPPGHPENAVTLTIPKKAWPAHSLNHGDVVGQCFKDMATEELDNQGNLERVIDQATCQTISATQGGSGKVEICHNVREGKSSTPTPDLPCNGNSLSNHLDQHDDNPAHMYDTIAVDIDGDGDVECGFEGPAIDESDCPQTDVDGPTAEKQFVGLRFEYVDIPQGATITSAKIRFNSAAKYADTDDSATFVVRVQDTANAASFTGNNKDISNRTVFGNVEWPADNNIKKGGHWSSTDTPETPDLSELVQHVVGDTVSANHGWCGGQSIAFVIEGDDNGTLHRVWSYDGDPDLAPRLEVEFTTTSQNEGCINQSYSTQISASENDAEEKRGSVGTGQVTVTNVGSMGSHAETLEIGTSGGKRMVGLRFENVPISSGTDNIVEAYLILRAQDDSNANDGNQVSLTITGEAALNSAAFEEGDSGLPNYNLSNRSPLNNTVSWTITEHWQAGKFYRSADIKSIVQQMVNQTGWDASDNSMTFFLTGDNGTGTREAVPFDADPSQAATLHIKVNGRFKEASSQDSISIIIDKMIEPDYLFEKDQKHSLTPIVDALYESLMYYRGGEVTYGKDRQGQKMHLISDPGTYTHRSNADDSENPLDPEFVRSNDCLDVVESDPFDRACKDERIKYEPEDNEAVGLTPKYNSPIEQVGDCKSNNYIVLLTDGEASVNQSAANNGPIKNLFEDEFPEGIASNNKCNTFGDFDESPNEECGIALAKFLHEQNDVVTRTVSFGLAEGTDELKYLDVMAKAGGSQQGVYKIDTSDPSTVTAQLAGTFKKIVIDATKGTSSFAPAGIAISRFNRMRHDNQVYYALFENATTRSWVGNVKKFEFKQVDTTSDSKPLCADDTPDENCQLMLVGKDGKVAVDGFYLSDSAADMWSDQDSGAGQITSGGAGGQLLGSITENSVDDSSSTTRTILTYTGTPPTFLGDLTSSADPYLAQATVDWIKGAGDPHPNRSWLMAESLHSSPTAITYGEHDNNYTKVVVGTNDGLLRMIDAKTGLEDWAFLPPELYSIQADLMANGQATDPDPRLGQHIYGMDGTPTLWVKENNTIRLFVGMRRGGHHYYGLDVTTADTPELMWVIGDEDTGFTNLGQTWSSPKPVRVHSGYCNAITEDDLLDPEDGTCIAVMFGGGYDPALDVLEEVIIDEDADGVPDVPPTQTVKNHKASSSVGNAIYMVHATSGRLLWKASPTASTHDLALTEMDYPIPADLTILDTDGDGIKDRVYAADVAGQVWRIDLLGKQKETDGGAYADQSRGGRLADLSATDTANKRQLFYSPTWGYTEAGGEVIAITSGSRVYPKTLRNVQNRVYVIYDNSTWTENADTGRDELATTMVTESDLQQIGGSAGDSTKGWYKNLVRTGEKGLARPVILKNATEKHPNRKLLLFTTYTPAPLPGSPESAGQCTFEGTSRLYTLNLSDGSPASVDSDDTDSSEDDSEDPSNEDPPGGGGGSPDGSSPDGSSPDDGDSGDGSKKIGSGINSDINLMYTEKTIEAVVGNQAHSAGKRPPPQRVFWIQEQ